MIELQGVTKRFGDRVAVDNLSLTVESGEVCVLVGSSGCGKSTTLRMINRLLPHDAGRILIDGRQIASFDPQTLRRGIGYAIQGTGLFPHWTVARNIGLVPRLLGWSPADIEARVTELLNLLGLPPETFAGKFPHALSGGQAQRVGVARALAGNPNILLMDEPFGALDAITRENLQQEMLRIQAQLHKTIVFVTHDIDEALRLASRIVVMHEGRVMQYDSPDVLLRRPANAFVENLIGSQDRGLKAAALRQVSELLDREAPTDDLSGEAPALLMEDTLRQALSLMFRHHRESLRVVDGNGDSVGVIRLSRLMAEGF
ncbi:ABC transporter ATP-binding protein [Mangrovitalea sediminis]|uniref:ABC transporter ATP-binding protein n=1 Tax=Mangrovitalea sediminis TaxID=1982043 RepID=UPI000BE4F34D|nr:ABC transporter ATP-binding protein [Mangrovitalea sediminis]